MWIFRVTSHKGNARSVCTLYELLILSLTCNNNRCMTLQLEGTLHSYSELLTHYGYPNRVVSSITTEAGTNTVLPITSHEVPEGEYRYSSTLSLTSALEGGRWSTTWPGRFTPEKTRYLLCRRPGRPQGRSEWVREILPPTEIRSPDRPVRSESLYRLSYRGPSRNQHYLKWFNYARTAFHV